MADNAFADVASGAPAPNEQPPVSTSGGLMAEIVTTGTEILLGEIVDTNAAWIAQQLREIGVNLYYKTTVGDNFGRISQVIEQGMARSNVIIVSGGLGPTVDDVTRHAIAAATRRELAMHPAALAALKARFERLGAQMTENNLQQALIPADAIVIENPVGTAPGFIVESEIDGHFSAVIAVPGVPREMKHLMTETVLPYLRGRTGNVGVIERRVLRTIGIGESMIDDRLDELMHGHNPTVGLAAHTAQADVRITARGEDADAADALLDGLEAEIRRRIGDHIYSVVPGQSIEEVVADVMAKRKASVAVVERHTHGALAARLANVGGGTRVRQSWQDDVPADVPAALAAAWQKVQAVEDADLAVAALDLAQSAAEAVDAQIGVAVLGSIGADNGVYGRDGGQTAVAVYGVGALDPQGTEISRTLLLPYGAGDEYSVIRIGNQVLALLWNLLK
ncbi:MAG: CinA family nicotinamide mononucleotide deamidase-related protein [Litorilinea sp.]